jgi:hypothetical protein
LSGRSDDGAVANGRIVAATAQTNTGIVPGLQPDGSGGGPSQRRSQGFETRRPRIATTLPAIYLCAPCVQTLLRPKRASGRLCGQRAHDAVSYEKESRPNVISVKDPAGRVRFARRLSANRYHLIPVRKKKQHDANGWFSDEGDDE